MNSNELSVVMNQVASDAELAQTPLHHAQLEQLAAHTQTDDAGILLGERGLTGQLVLRIRGDLADASRAVESVLGLSLPDRLSFHGDPTDANGCALTWLSPDEWRLCCPIDRAFELEKALRNELSTIPGVTHAIVNNSGGFTLIDLSGRDALNLLKKSTGYDVRPHRFPIGKAVGTTFAKTSITLLRVGENQWQIWARRSFADYLWLWLQPTSRDYGLHILKE